MPFSPDLAAMAFNEGSQARIEGKRLSQCIYVNASPLALWWRIGWKDLSRWWGFSVKGRWTITPLPELENKPSASAA